MKPKCITQRQHADHNGEATKMEQLPVETLTHALKLLDISSRVKLASCNHTLQQRVYRECSEAWKKLKFYDRTDLDLSRLLLCLMP
jgi:hypothetical protein